MTTLPASFSPLPDAAAARLAVQPAGPLNLRRDLFLFTDFVRREGLKRTHRTNAIPKGPALKLAKLLSWGPEAEALQKGGEGEWSDFVSLLARDLGLVSFDVEGVYAGYSSHEPSYPDNEIEVDAKYLGRWLAAEPLEKERAILDKLIETTGNEFFCRPRIGLEEDRFDPRGCAIGPASRMRLPSIRKGLLELLAELPAGVWLPIAGLIEWVKATAPTLILEPGLRRRPRTDADTWALKRGEKLKEFDELYENFRERPGRDRYGAEEIQLTHESPDVFRRVEGRYLQYFLQAIPVLCGFVELAMAPAPSGKERVFPRLESVRAFRLSPRLRQVVRGDPELQRVGVTVLPNFDVLVEAPSWPDRELAALAPYTQRIKEDGPTHLLRLDRDRILAHAASAPTASAVKPELEKLCSRPLPTNVAAELDEWCGHAQKLTVWEDVALVELREPEEASRVRAELGKLVQDDRPKAFVVAGNPDRTIAVLEQRQRVPRVVKHPAERFGACDGPLGTKSPEPEPPPSAPARKKVRLAVQDLVGYRSEDAELLAALHQAVGRTARLEEGGKLLLVSAADLPLVRAALKRLEGRFEVELER